MADLKKLLGDSYREDMTFAEVAEAFKKVSVVDKALYDKKASDLAAANHALAERENDDASATSELELRVQTLEEENQRLTNERQISEAAKRFLGLGYEETLAQETAEALISGDQDKLFTNQKKFFDQQKAKTKKQALLDTPTPSPGAGKIPSGPMNYAKLAAEASRQGNIAQAAYYTRLQAQELSEGD